jgi:hypothetical protein
MEQKKVAIVFFGLTRSIKTTYNSIKTNIYDVLKEHNLQVDTYLHTYKLNSPYINPWSGEHVENYDNETYKILNPDFCIIEEQSEIIKSINFEEYYSKLGDWSGGMSSDLTKYLIKNMLLALHSKKTITKLLEDNINNKNYNYDFIIIIRPDLEILSKINVCEIREILNTNNIIIPSQDAYCGCNDRLCFCLPNIAIYYGNLYDQLLEYSKQKSIISERYLLDMLNLKNITIINSNFKYNTIRI